MDAMHRALEALRGRATEAELVEIHSHNVTVNVNNNTIKGARAVDRLGYSLRVIRDGRLGFATATSIADPKAIITAALETAPFGDQVTFSFAGPGNGPTAPGLSDARTAALPLEDLARMASELCDRIKEAVPKGVAGTDAYMTTEHVRIVTTRGQDCSFERTRFDLSAGSQLSLEGDLRFSFDGFMGTGLPGENDKATIAKRIARQMELSETICPVKGGPMDVVFLPMAATELLWPLSASLNGDAIVRKSSQLAGRIGELMFSPDFSLFDECALTESPFSAPIDDEGTPCSRRAIIENGVLRGYLLDRRSASALGAEPTGSGFKVKILGGKDYEEAPQSTPCNWVVTPGQKTTEEMIAAVSDGLLIGFLGGTHSASHLSGDVAGSVFLGFKIENGKLVGRVKNAMLTTSVFDAFKSRLAGVSSDPELVSHPFVPAGYLMPAVYLNGVDISVGG